MGSVINQERDFWVLMDCLMNVLTQCVDNSMLRVIKEG